LRMMRERLAFGIVGIAIGAAAILGIGAVSGDGADTDTPKTCAFLTDFTEGLTEAFIEGETPRDFRIDSLDGWLIAQDRACD